jgi:hypothetical protein
VDLFLRASARSQHDWVLRCPGRLAWFCALAIVLGSGCYGAVMGSWRDPLQAFYTGVKVPMVILLTALGNGLLNGMLALLLGMDLKFRQSLVLVLVSFALTALLLAALSPVALFLIWNTPPLSAATNLSSPEYGFMQLSLAGFISIAGITGVVHLLPLLKQWTDNNRVARKILFAWLTTNLFLGSQVCWVLRPFIWDPAGKISFIGHEYFRGSFYETVFEAARRMIF